MLDRALARRRCAGARSAQHVRGERDLDEVGQEARARLAVGMADLVPGLNGYSGQLERRDIELRSFKRTLQLGAANMKAGRSNQEASRLPNGRANRSRVHRRAGFRRQFSCLDRPFLGPYLRPMRQGQASVAALGAAGHRAAHQVLERGLVFADPLALRILGPDAADAIALAKERPERRPLRLFIAMRSRFAEDSARRAIENGVRQILVMGAGLDTFAYRLQPTPDLRIFELDHPATQAEKWRRLTRGANRRAPPRRLCRPRFRARKHDRGA